jgi:hypothetical protein
MVRPDTRQELNAASDTVPEEVATSAEDLGYWNQFISHGRTQMRQFTAITAISFCLTAGGIDAAIPQDKAQSTQSQEDRKEGHYHDGWRPSPNT